MSQESSIHGPYKNRFCVFCGHPAHPPQELPPRFNLQNKSLSPPAKGQGEREELTWPSSCIIASAGPVFWLASGLRAERLQTTLYHASLRIASHHLASLRITSHHFRITSHRICAALRCAALALSQLACSQVPTSAELGIQDPPFRPLPSPTRYDYEP